MQYDCETVVTIPQYTGTCWFNALLMATLYSQHIRNLLLNKLEDGTLNLADETHAQRKELHSILLDIITKHHRAADAVTRQEMYDHFFAKVTPEFILDKLHSIDKKVFHFDPKQNEGFIHYAYIHRFLDFLGVSDVHSMVVVSNTLVHVPVQKWSFVIRDNKKIYVTYPSYTSPQHANKVYDIVLVHREIILNDINNQINFKHEENIIINGETYILDSLLLVNFNKLECGAGHEICGITCQGQRYLYNGWMKRTKDAARKLSARSSSSSFKTANIPCGLMKYDWLNKKGQFCIDDKDCTLYTSNNHDLTSTVCFDISRGVRTYVYVNAKRSHRTNQSPDIRCAPRTRKAKQPHMSDTESQKRKSKPARLPPVPPPTFEGRRRSCTSDNRLMQIQKSRALQSTLLAMFHDPKSCKPIIKAISDHNPIRSSYQDIKAELFYVISKMWSKDKDDINVSKLQKLLYGNTRISPQPTDIMQRIEKLFGLETAMTVRKTRVVSTSSAKVPPKTSWKVESETDMLTSMIRTIDISNTCNKDVSEVSIKTFFPSSKHETTPSSSTRYIDHEKIIDSPMLYVDIKRVQRRGAKDKNDIVVVPVGSLKLACGNKMLLKAIVVNDGGFYLCVYTCGGRYFLSDPRVSKSPTMIGKTLAELMGYQGGMLMRKSSAYIYMIS